MIEIGLRKDEVDTPYLWVDLDILEENIATIAGICRDAGVHWRPHFKGNKTPAIAQKILDAGAIGFTCAKLGEAEVLVEAGARDLLIANQIVGAAKYARLARLCRTADVKVAVDSAVTLPELNAAALSEQVRIGLVIELNTGMDRAGIAPGEATLALARAIGAFPGLQLRGLMTWEGHTLGIEDPEAKRAAIAAAIAPLRSTAELCRGAGIPIDILSCGGSGTFVVTAREPDVTEVEAGGAIFNDMTYSRWNVPTRPALFVQTVVTSRPTPTRVIVDAGWKTLPAWIGTPAAIGIQDVDHMAFSAEHGILTLAQPNETISVGDRIDFIPSYGDTTVVLHDFIYGMRDEVVEAVWPVLGRGKLR